MTSSVTIQVRWGGEGDWSTLFAMDAAIEDVVVGDFDGDRRSDLLVLNGSSWKLVFASGATSSWSGTLPLFALRAGSVRVAKLNGDVRDDVLFASGSSWLYVPSGVPNAIVTLGPARAPLGEVQFVDVNGDGITDALRVNQWWDSNLSQAFTKTQVSYGASSAFTDVRTVATPVPIRVPPVGRFDANPGADVIHWRADRRWDVSSSAIGALVLHSFDDGVTKNEMF